MRLIRGSGPPRPPLSNLRTIIRLSEWVHPFVGCGAPNFATQVTEGPRQMFDPAEIVGKDLGDQTRSDLLISGIRCAARARSEARRGA